MILIGNIISFGAAVCMLWSTFSRSFKNIFLLQFFECVLLAIANIFFGVYAGVAVLLLSATRNLLVAKGFYTKPVMGVCIVLTVVLSFLTNNRGFLGLIPMIATLQFTVCSLLVTSVKGTRLSILVNTLFWVVYSILIKDLSTFVSDSVVLFFTSFNLVRLLREERRIASSPE